MIVIIDYGLGNLGSLLNMLKKIGAEAQISSDPSVIERADKLILPGVGAFDNGIRNLNDLGLIPVLNKKVLEEKTPILGICLGIQLFTQKSEEGQLSGLGWINAQTKKFQFGENGDNLKIPHMGWNSISSVKESKLFQGVDPEQRYYFVHSYHLECDDQEGVLAKTRHGYDFISAIEKENIIGVQFHPEKSHKFGMKLLENFVNNY